VVLFEYVGGAAMLLGLGVPIVGVLMALTMVGAWVFVHTSPLFSMDANGPELVISLALLSLVLAALGSGRFGLDHLITGRRGHRVVAGACLTRPAPPAPTRTRSPRAAPGPGRPAWSAAC